MAGRDPLERERLTPVEDPTPVGAERPSWFDPYYEERRYARPNMYREQLHARFPGIVVPPREAEARAGRWKRHFADARGGGPARPLHVEIGCGLGEFIAAWAVQEPHVDRLGLELKFKRVWKTAEKIERAGAADRVRLVRYDADFLPLIVGAGEIDHLYAFHPDPWPKDRHHKHRLFSPAYLDQLRPRLAPGAGIEIKTDHADYFTVIHDLFRAADDFETVFATADLHGSERAGRFPPTVFERGFVAQGVPIGYLHAVYRPAAR